MAMTDRTDTPPPGEDDIDLLLPWYATERLDPAERARIAETLARDPELARRLALVEEEQVATALSHDALTAPSGRVRQDLFARIEALEGVGRRTGAGAGILDRLTGFFAALSPRTTAMAAGFAALLIVLQAGLLAGSLLRDDASFQVASHGTGREEGSLALVTFVPGATAEKIAETLGSRGMRIVNGPYPGAIFQVKLSAKPLEAADLQRALAELGAQTEVVLFVAPASVR
jgi:hypothetical protein